MQRVAVVDFGTNSTRLLIADVEGGRAAEVVRRTTVTRLGEGVDASGRLAEAAMERVHECVAGYVRDIEEHGAQTRLGVATSAVRDAENGEQFRRALEERHGLAVRTISGEEEARLTFLGATAGRAERETLVLDIGGGSTEFVIGRPGLAPGFHVSTRAGSVRHTERHLHHDPPKHEELERLAGEIRALIRDEVGEQSVEDGIAVAGTPTSLAAIDQELDPYDPARVHGYRLTLAAAERILALLAELPVSRRRETPGLHPDRAPTVVAGVVILVESMRAMNLDEIEVSEADILHGAAVHAVTRG